MRALNGLADHRSRNTKESYFDWVTCVCVCVCVLVHQRIYVCDTHAGLWIILTCADGQLSTSNEYTSTSSGLRGCMHLKTLIQGCFPELTSTYLALVAYWWLAYTASFLPGASVWPLWWCVYRSRRRRSATALSSCTATQKKDVTASFSYVIKLSIISLFCVESWALQYALVCMIAEL